MGYRMTPPEASCKRPHAPSEASQAIDAPRFSGDGARLWQPVARAGRTLKKRLPRTCTRDSRTYYRDLYVTQICHAEARKGEAAMRSFRGTVDASSGEREEETILPAGPGRVE
jgi:hypothetical protein